MKERIAIRVIVQHTADACRGYVMFAVIDANIKAECGICGPATIVAVYPHERLGPVPGQ